MKPTLLLGCALLAGTTLYAQFSMLPYAGFEQARNTLNYGNGYSAPDVNGFLKAGLRMDYRFKTGHSPFVNLTTNPAATRFSFDKTGQLLNQFRSGNQLFRIETGYQYSSKPIRLGKKSSPQAQQTPLAFPSVTQKKQCGSQSYRSSCGAKKSRMATAPENKPLNMRLQPSLALAYLPAAEQRLQQTANGFDFTPSWKTAVVPAMGFEFARGNQRLFTLGVFYTRPLAQRTEMAATQLESKIINTRVQPQASTWGLSLGVPFSFASRKTAVTKTQTQKKQCSPTSSYKRCMRLS